MLLGNKNESRKFIIGEISVMMGEVLPKKGKIRRIRKIIPYDSRDNQSL